MTNFDRRTFLKLTGAAAGLASLSACAGTAGSGGGPRVVVVGGGFGGATAAKYLRRLDPSLQVTLVDRNPSHVTCPFSNAVLGGLRDLPSITQGFDGLRAAGVKVVTDEVTALDVAGKAVVLKKGGRLAYDRLVLSPGIDVKWNALAGYDEAAAELAPHAWKAGPQTALLRRQLEALPDGGVVLLSAPGNPYRCPPGPYERASLIAHYLKAHKPRSKLLLLDSKDSFSKQGLFEEAWASQFKGIIEWVPAAKDGKVVRVDAKSLTVETELGTRHKAHVLNIIPPQTAGRIVVDAGLTDASGWVPVVPATFQSTKAPDIYVVGDATVAAPMPKSGFTANAQAKVAAAALVADLRGKPAPEPLWMNTCYSLITPSYGISIAGVYRVIDGKLGEVKGSGGVSPRGASATFRQLEAEYAFAWYDNIVQDTWG